jgi:hypothetical protein
MVRIRRVADDRAFRFESIVPKKFCRIVGRCRKTGDVSVKPCFEAKEFLSTVRNWE